MKESAALLRATDEFAREDRLQTWKHIGVASLLFSILIAGTLFRDTFLAFRIALSVLAGVTAVRIFVFYHDYLHGAILRGSTLGKAYMWGVGILMLNPPNVWKRSHNYHHKHNTQIATSSIGSFPLMTVDQYRSANLRARVAYHFARNPLFILLGYLFIFLIGMCGKSFLTDPRRHWDSLLAIGIHFTIAISLFWFFHSDIAILAFILPINVACIVGAYLFYVQHNFPGVKIRPRSEWDYVDAALHSSSYMKASSLVHWFTGNIGFHHVHHLNPKIPFYRLPQVMQAFPPLQKPGMTSLAIPDIYRCLRLKLWDPRSQRLMSFSEAARLI